MTTRKHTAPGWVSTVSELAARLRRVLVWTLTFELFNQLDKRRLLRSFIVPRVRPDYRVQIEIPEYVRESAEPYQIDEFRALIERVDIRGKRILEIGSDYHMCSARLFQANGALDVVGTNIGDWRSLEALPVGVELKVGDVADVEYPADSFDIIYGIAVLEHIVDFDRVCAALKTLLRPGGVIYLQGEPIWSGPQGHHLWYQPESAGASAASSMHDPVGGPVLYRFDEAARNPIPDWAHLVLGSHEMEDLLIRKGVPASHAAGITRFVYNLGGDKTGSCSNFQSASAIIAALSVSFDIEAERIAINIDEERIHSVTGKNQYYRRALRQYSKEDLWTRGLVVWMRHKSDGNDAVCVERNATASGNAVSA
ncbi:class I SAM-dependent methyltransferase [Thiocapsa bogorovii]|uniref:class I SAM-dependent methyltransferase n=1 Tax=Thiocapsa bogorovii TaxID=521689 RepID=UPI001E53D4CB|nr:methyltransferase domain-containing protein [Thiocapsa bogorovii]UHD14567.1 class I SAM-dependent methyltransferase [Thiocapsa bogorovii]